MGRMGKEGDHGSKRQQLDEEMELHLDLLTEDLIREGMEPTAARREAVRRFGNRERVQERHREERGLALMDEVGRNLRFALRGIARDPVFSTTFVLTTALTVALGGLAWAVGDATLWRDLPYPSPDRLVRVSMYDASRGPEPVGTAVDGATWEQYRDAGPDYPSAVYTGWGSGVNLTAGGTAAFVNQQRVGAGYFSVLGVEPSQGREFTEAEDVPEGPDLVILSHDLWQRSFAGEPMLGRTVRLKGEPHEVVGIMPERFRSSVDADLWTPLRPSPVGEGGGTNYSIVARLPEGLGLDEAHARLGAVPPAESWAQRDGDQRFGLLAYDLVSRRGAETPINLLMGGIALMLLIGWANLAGLQIARTLSRMPELATRRALGGGSGAIVRQLGIETFAIGVAGGLLGAVGLIWGAPAMETVVASRFGTWQPFPGPLPLLAVAGVLTLCAIVVSGLAPVLRAARPGLARAVVSGSRVRGRADHVGRRLLLVGQLGLATVLVFSAGLLARSYGHLAGLDRGFDPEGVLTVQYSLDDARFAEAEVVRALFDRTLAALEGRSEVAGAAVALTLPYERPLNLVFRHPGEEEGILTSVVYVTPGFFEMLDITVRQGRVFDSRDTPDAPTVMVANQAFVDANLEGRDPLTATLQGSAGLGEAVPIVGVVGNVQQSAGWGNTSQPVWETPTLYVSAEQMTSGFFAGMHVWFAPSWLVKSSGVGNVAEAVSETFRGVAADLPVARTATLEQVVDGAFARQRLEATFLLAMAGFALVLAGIGLYGLVSQEVLERRGEMGVRMALGSSPQSAIVRAGSQGVRLALMGLGAGILLSLLVAKLFESLIWGVGSLDPLTFLGASGVLVALAAVASFVPALRIGRMDPATVLRED